MKKIIFFIGLLSGLIMSGMLVSSCGDDDWDADDIASLTDDRGNPLTYDGWQYSFPPNSSAEGLSGGDIAISSANDTRTEADIPSRIKYKGQIYEVRRIAYMGFYQHHYLTTVRIPNTVWEIQGAAFSGCYNLTSISLPKDLEVINARCFRDCRELSSIDIPIYVREIKEQAFYGCSNLKSVYLHTNDPNSIALSSSAFDTWSNITLYVPKGNVSKFQNQYPWNQFGKIKEGNYSY